MGIGVGARTWVLLVTVLGIGLTMCSFWSGSLSWEDGLGFVGLVVGAVFAHRYPLRLASHSAAYRLTNALLMTGAIILPAPLLSPLVLAAITPDAWRSRHRVGAWHRWQLAVSQTAVAAHAAGAWVRWAGPQAESALAGLGVHLVGALLFVGIQAVSEGIADALRTRTPLLRAGSLAPSPLLHEGSITLIGLLVAGIWQAESALLLLAAPVLGILFRVIHAAHSWGRTEAGGTWLQSLQDFERTVEEEIARSQRLQRPMALLLANMDHMRQVNSTHGQLAGDRILQETAHLLSDSIRESDLIARFPGHDFAVLLPQTDESEAAYVAKRIRNVVAEHPFVLGDGTVLRCTMSIGVAIYPQDASSLTELVRRAGQALGRAKELRDTVIRVEATGSSAEPARPALPANRPASWSRGLLWAIIVMGLAGAAGAMRSIHLAGEWLHLLMFLPVAIGAELLNVQVMESGKQRISLSFTIAVTMAAVVMAPSAAPLVSLTAAGLHVAMRKQRQWEKALFNLANPTMAALVAAGVTGWLSHYLSDRYLAISLVATLAFYATNTGLTTLIVSLHTRRPFLDLVRESTWFAPANVLLGVSGAYLGHSYGAIGLAGIAVFVIPLLIIRYTLVLYATRTQQTITALQRAMAETEQAQREREETLRSLIETVSSLIDARDHAVHGHSRRVADYATALGKQLGLSPEALAEVYTAGLLHDVGKIAIPEVILHKPSRLTEAEYEVMKTHASIGRQILSEVKPLQGVARIVGDHHERFDGTGYPARRQGDEISLGGRLLSVADALDSILSDRPYSKGRGLDWAIEEINRCAGGHFDPEVVLAFNRVVEAEGPTFFSVSRQVTAEAAVAGEDPQR